MSYSFAIVTGHAPVSMGFSRKEYWSCLPFPPLGNIPNPEIEPGSPGSLALAGGFFTTNATWEALCYAKSLQSCTTLCDPIDGSPPGSPVPGILQARTREWVAISFSNAWKWKWKWSRSVVSDSSRPHWLQPTRLLRPWDFPGKSILISSINRL